MLEDFYDLGLLETSQELVLVFGLLSGELARGEQCRAL